MDGLLLYLEETYGLTSEKKIDNAIGIVANENKYHPIRDYLSALVWDGTERIRFCLRHFLGADTDKAVQVVPDGMVAVGVCEMCIRDRVFPVAEGGKAAGKLAFLRFQQIRGMNLLGNVLAVHLVEDVLELSLIHI